MYQLIEWNASTKPSIGVPITERISLVKTSQRLLLKDVTYIEDEFSIPLQLLSTQEKNPDEGACLTCYIGQRACEHLEGYHYDIDTNTFRGTSAQERYIIASSEKSRITSTQYLLCLLDLMDEAMRLNKKLLINRDKVCMNKKQNGYLLNQVISQWLDVIDGKFVNMKVSKQEGRSMQRASALFDDVFYDQIANDQEIYLPMAVFSNVSKEKYEELGFEYIPILSFYGILRGTKKQFDASADLLYDNVFPQFRPQILLPAPLQVNSNMLSNNNAFTPSAFYKGREVYVAIVCGEGVDYENALLMNEDKKTRIEYVWEQVEGNKGNVYTEEHIQEAIDQKEKLSIYPESGDYLSTSLLGIAAGSKVNNYEGMGSEAKLLMAKIKKAPQEIQKIYAGTTVPTSVLLEDVCIGLNNLIEYAASRRKPIVICLPYGSNISGHDGKKILETKIGEIAMQPGVTILTMTGEEANKSHHTTLQVNSEIDSRANVMIEKENQAVVGTIWINPVYEVAIYLYNPMTNKSYDLTKNSIYIDGEQRIISSGQRARFYNGIKQIFFTMDHMAKGTWQLIVNESVPHKNIYQDKVDVWIAQEEINKFTKLSPADVFTTITSIGNIDNLICVGNYSEKIFNVQQSSGRGYTRNNFIKPTLVTEGEEIPAMIGNNVWGSVTGSVAAMAKMAGVAAAIYSKYIEMGERWLPNSLIMGSIMINNLDRVELVDYPNKSQGNGIFSQTSVEEVLRKESIF